VGDAASRVAARALLPATAGPEMPLSDVTAALEPAPEPTELLELQEGYAAAAAARRLENQTWAAEEILTVPALAEWAASADALGTSGADARMRLAAGLPTSFASTKMLTEPAKGTGRPSRPVQSRSELPAVRAAPWPEAPVQRWTQARLTRVGACALQVQAVRLTDETWMARMRQVLQRPAIGREDQLRHGLPEGYVDWSQVRNHQEALVLEAGEGGPAIGAGHRGANNQHSERRDGEGIRTPGARRGEFEAETAATNRLVAAARPERETRMVGDGWARTRGWGERGRGRGRGRGKRQREAQPFGTERVAEGVIGDRGLTFD
jgi:hypothetical protein